MRALCPLLLSLFALAPAFAQPLPVDDPPAASFPGVGTIQAERIRSDLGFICSDTLEGRGSGARGGYRAGDWLALQLAWLGLKPAGTKGYHQPFTVSGRRMRNVLATIPGQGSEEVVVIGAHYDHCGFGEVPGSGGPRGSLHNGADDNGSGTSALLSIARAFVLSGVRHKRRVVFAFFDGEERGLLGSKHWVSSPTVRGRVVLMINLDMVGRLRKSVELSHNGGQQVRGYVERANRLAGLRLTYPSRISANSDHWPFYRNRTPVVFPFTGFHPDYHEPSDDLDKINADGIQKIARLSYCIAYQALNDASSARCADDEEIPTEDPPYMGCHMHPDAPRKRDGLIRKLWPTAKPTRSRLPGR